MQFKRCVNFKFNTHIIVYYTRDINNIIYLYQYNIIPRSYANESDVEGVRFRHLHPPSDNNNKFKYSNQKQNYSSEPPPRNFFLPLIHACSTGTCQYMLVPEGIGFRIV